ncbi:hypothetical protein AFLA_004601 [Aspergillus flavus NRRL3357]|nr:hypothetical protein AFLA_004601 [Aspergillus flavus NRRL3357]
MDYLGRMSLTSVQACRSELLSTSTIIYSPPDLGPYLPVWDSHELAPTPSLPIAILSKISRDWGLDYTRSRAASFNIQPESSGGGLVPLVCVYTLDAIIHMPSDSRELAKACPTGDDRCTSSCPQVLVRGGAVVGWLGSTCS